MDQLTLKWGGLKAWELESPKALEAMEKYFAEPVLMSAAMQRDTSAQQDAILEMIDAVAETGGEIWNDWSGEQMTAEEAKKYVTEYRK